MRQVFADAPSSFRGHARKPQFFRPSLEPLEERALPSTNIWTAGAASDHNWNTGSNWSLGHAPIVGEIATFGQVGSLGNNQDCTINAGANRCDGLSITMFYSGTISAAANLALVGPTGYSQSGGTFNLVSFTIHDAGVWSRSSPFPSNTFNAGTGTVDFNLPSGGGTTVQTEVNAGTPFFNVTHSGSATLQLNENLTLNGSLLNSAGTLNANNKNITLAGNWTDSASITNLATVTFNGTGTENVLANSPFNNLFINVGSGNVVKLLTMPITINGDFSNSSGTFDANHLDMTVGGNWTNADTLMNTNNVTFNAASGVRTLDNGTSTLLNVIHSGAGTLQLLNSPLMISGTLTDSAGVLDAFGLDLTVAGLTTITGSVSTITNSGAADTLALNGGLSMTGGKLSSNQGTAVLGPSGITATSDANTAALISGTLALSIPQTPFVINRGPQATDLTIAAVINNPGPGMTGGFRQSGTGILALTSANNYTGGTDILAGSTLIASADGALGPGIESTTVEGVLILSGGVNYTIPEAVNLRGGTLASDTGTGATVDTFAGPINLAFSSNLRAGAGSTLDLKGSTITMQGSQLTVLGTGNTVIDDVLSGTSAASLSKKDSGTLTLNAANSYGGGSVGTSVTGGTLAVGNDSALGTGLLTLSGGTTLQASGGAHILGSNITLIGAVTIGGTNSLALNGVIGGAAGSLTQTDIGTLLLGGANSYGGGTTVNAGILALGTDTSAGSGLITFNNIVSVLAVSSARTLANAVSLGASAMLTVAGTQNFTFNGVISGASGALISTDPGVLTLNGANTFGGGVAINAGTLSVGNDSALGTGTLTLSDLRTIQSVGGAHTIANNATFIDRVTITGSNNITFPGVITSSGVNPQLTKVGSGSATLSGNNSSYSANIFVNAGALYVNGQQPNTPVTVTSGATFGGTGHVGNVTVNGGILQPGTATSAGILTTGNVQFGSGSTFVVPMNGPATGSGYGQLNVIGTVTLGTTNATLSLPGAFVPRPGDTLAIINNDGSDPISGTFNGLADGASVVINGVTTTIHYAGGTGNDVTLTVPPAKSSILGRYGAAGQWWMAASTGTSFTNSLWATWNPNVTWVDVQTGDFNGDGHADIIGRVLQTGQWYVGISNGSDGFTTSLWASWNPNVTWVDVHVGDFNGDGKADIVGRYLQGGQWYVGISNGTSFTTTLWATWNPNVTWVDVNVGDFTGNGKTGVTGRFLQGGSWWTGVSSGSDFATSQWASWNPAVTWTDVQVGDFNGDGKADITGRFLQGGSWWTGISTGSSFNTTMWAAWNPNVTWVDVKVGDFNGDGMTDIIGRFQQTGQWWVGISNGSSFATTLWATWNPNATWVDIQIGDFSGDGKDDLAGRYLQGGQWYTGVSNGSSAFTTTLWDTWSPAANWVDVQHGRYL
ncbi:MAG TPA: autotransporter-associated beta strand repeat-containing protein [Gemmataceae bacterium]|nr:autotransporter-associated beta strand repeat-containing protein [Gemmataceae bacterium]